MTEAVANEILNAPGLLEFKLQFLKGTGKNILNKVMRQMTNWGGNCNSYHRAILPNIQRVLKNQQRIQPNRKK